ncbi:hypothetical protein RHS01_01937 [Rhizoctonia solani]|uniref:Uncharacterized protein n=1 Tax=Rhizoctonia solani TaxID=456999 RepID=A0A8H7ILI3_9AGAM|nr:hypothetical protein RHS01_01937 [Rhizoctonia solani]
MQTPTASFTYASSKRNAAAHRGGVSSLVVCLLMLYSDNWLRLGVPSRAVISMEDALIAQEQIGEESEEDRQHATLAASSSGAHRIWEAGQG